MDVFCGIDWAEDHHDHRDRWRGRHAAGPAKADRRQARPGSPAPAGAARRRTATPPEDPVPVCDRDPRAGLLVACPARQPDGRSTPSTRWRWPAYRDRQLWPAGRKSDPGRRGGARQRAGAPTCTRTGRCRADSELAQAIAVLARAPAGTRYGTAPPAHNKLRSPPARVLPGLPRRVRRHPGTGSCGPRPRVILAAAARPPPRAGKPQPSPSCGALLKKGRTDPRQSTPRARRLRRGVSANRQNAAASRSSSRPWADRPWPCLRQLDAACTSAGDLEHAAVESF